MSVNKIAQFNTYFRSEEIFIKKLRFESKKLALKINNLKKIKQQNTSSLKLTNRGIFKFKITNNTKTRKHMFMTRFMPRSKYSRHISQTGGFNPANKAGLVR